MYTVNDLYRDPPLVHWGGEHTFYVAQRVAAYLFDALRPGMTTIETGCGLSTVVFALRGCRHTVVTPRAEEAARVTDYLARREIDMSQLDFRIGPSQDVLPTLPLGKLDLALIDGQHAFPIPFMDWYFCDRRLRSGGVVVVDDTQLWTGHVLRDFLAAEPGWHRVHDFFGRSAVFKKLTEETEAGWWGQQPYVLAHSRPSQWRESIRRRWWVATRRICHRYNRKAPMSVAAQRITDDDQ